MPEETLCERTSKQARTFLADLLSDAEYQVVALHSEGCASCRDYLRSLGDVTNQVWSLGQIDVPPDFARTVLFRTRRIPGKRRPVAIATAVLICLSLAAVSFFVANRPASHEASAPVMRVSLAAHEPEVLSEAAFPAAVEEPSVPPSAVAEPVPAVQAPVPSVPSPAPPASSVHDREIHWHLVHSEEWQTAAAERREKLARLHADALELTALEEEVRRLESAQEEGAGRKEKTRALNERAKELKEGIRTLEETSKEVVRAPDLRAWFSGVLFDAGIRFESPTPGIFSFRATEERVARVTEATLSTGVYAPSDFAASTASATDEERKVIVYAEASPDAGLHWHLKVSAARRTSFSDALREYGASVLSESGDSLIFLISRDSVRKLEARLRGLGIGLVDFGRAEPKGTVLGDVPVTVSAHFTN